MSLTPRAIQIDATSHCQLACPLCPTATGQTRTTLGSGHLKLADFVRLLDDNPEIAEVELSNYGEMFLNPQLPELLACAFEHKVVVRGNNGVNLNYASEDALEAVVKYRVAGLTCSIDGATQETYARYRVNGNLNRVLAHVDRIRELRRNYRSAFPVLNWQFVVFGHNEHEIEPARQLAQQRGMTFLPRLSWSGKFSPVVNDELVAIQTGLAASSRAEYRERTGREYTRELCSQLWHAPVLNWDGRMLGCCVNYWQPFDANVFETGLARALIHPDLEYARRMLMGTVNPRPEIPCTKCANYEALADSGRWLTEQEVNSSAHTGILAGVVPLAPEGVKFGLFTVVQGAGAAMQRRNTGRVFRFGLDSGVYFIGQATGIYTVVGHFLGSEGWLAPQARQIQLADRPVCQEFQVDFRSLDYPVVTAPADIEWSPMWIA